MHTSLSLRPWVAALMLALAAGPAAAQTRSLVVSTYGFNGDLLKKHVYEPFKAQCKCELVIETGNAALQGSNFAAVLRRSLLQGLGFSPNFLLGKSADFTFELIGKGGHMGFLCRDANRHYGAADRFSPFAAS